MDSLSTITTPIARELEEFRTHFARTLHSDNALLAQVLAHVGKRSGKMMRPMLVLLVAKLCGGRVTPATLHAAVSLELLHTASLVHDDVVDESDERRGQQSVNAHYGNKVAVLAGDYLLATALVEVGQTANLDIIGTVARLGCALSEGELLQLQNVDNSDFSEEIYFDVIRQKTAALFAACTRSAALSVGATPAQTDAATRLGECIGVCFQIKDDIFDYSDNADLGKPTGNDMREGKLTLPALYALNSTGNAAARDLALRVKRGTATDDEIARLVQFTKLNGGLDYAECCMRQYRNRAIDLLPTDADPSLIRALTAYVDYVVSRKK